MAQLTPPLWRPSSKVGTSKVFWPTCTLVIFNLLHCQLCTPVVGRSVGGWVVGLNIPTGEYFQSREEICMAALAWLKPDNLSPDA